jgi:hypothetical protein
MSVKVIENQIRKFLNSDMPEVLSICGEWGIGKTFLWNKLIKEAKGKNRIELKSYSYVSLFGINSLDELKLSVFSQIIPRASIGQQPSFSTFKNNVRNMFSRWRKGNGFFKSISVIKNFASVIDAVSFLSIYKTIVCIDDFERKGSDLKFKDVLGLVSLLKEQKSCKIVLIFNGNALEGEDKNEYQQFREKVIDTELILDPAAAESISIIGWDIKNGVYKKLMESAIKLDIRNIRILKKIERLAIELEWLLTRQEPEVLKQALHSLVLLCGTFYTDKKKFDFLKNLDEMFNFSDEKDDKEIKKWKLQLQDYNYTTTDDFDLVIADAVENGYISEDKLIVEAEKLSEQAKATSAYGSFKDAWKIYRESFDNNVEEVINTIYESFMKNYNYISPYSLNAAVKLFRKLDRNELADKLITIYIEKRESEKELFNVVNSFFGNDSIDGSLEIKFNTVYQAHKPAKTIGDILQYIAENRAWIGEDKKILDDASEQEYYDFFKAEHGEQLGSLVSASLLAGIGQAKNALIRIGKENKLNGMRVASLGIKINEESK